MKGGHDFDVSEGAQRKIDAFISKVFDDSQSDDAETKDIEFKEKITRQIGVKDDNYFNRTIVSGVTEIKDLYVLNG